MARGTFVATYALEIYATGSEEPAPLSYAAGRTLYGEIKRILEQMCAGYVHDDDEQNLLRVRHNATGRVTDGSKLGVTTADLFGLFERGEYGYASRGVKADTFVASFVRDATDAEMLPYYFRFHLPADEHAGFLLLQRTGIHSPFTQLKGHLEAQFRESNPGWHLAVRRLLPAKIVEALTEGKVRTFRVITHTRTRDRADSFLRGTEAQIGTMEIVWRAKRNQALWQVTPRFLRDILAGRATVAKFFPEAESARIGVEYKGRTRQFDVVDLADAAPYLDVTEEIGFKDGHPRFTEIDQYCLDLVQELRQQMNMAGA